MDYLQRNIDITHFSNFKTPAKAEYYFEINESADLEKLPDIYKFSKDNNKSFLCIGWGTNLLFWFDVFDGVIIKNNLKWWRYNHQTKILESYSNESIRQIAQVLEIDDGQSLWHRFIWLPGSIWGAIFGNAGCFGLEIENNFHSAAVIDLDKWDLKIFESKDMQFSYRSSILKTEFPRYFLVSCMFDLSEKKEKYHSNVDNIYFREHKQPKGNSCGSFFKNPKVDMDMFFKDNPLLERDDMKSMSAGYLIENCGLKWHKIWWATLSKQHANFLMSDGKTCTHNDLLDLIKLAQKTVKHRFNIDLENEVRIITNEK